MGLKVVDSKTIDVTDKYDVVMKVCHNWRYYIVTEIWKKNTFLGITTSKTRVERGERVVNEDKGETIGGQAAGSLSWALRWISDREAAESVDIAEEMRRFMEEES